MPSNVPEGVIDIAMEVIKNKCDRNKAEDELASLLHLTIARPLPAVVTLGGMIDVTYLLDMPHGYTWKGVFVDADLRSVEAVGSGGVGVGSEGERRKLFMQLSSLQGSILENRIFEDDFQVESISTAKLFQLVHEPSATSYELLTIDKTNIDTLLPTLSVDDNVREDIRNSVNQNFIIRIPFTPLEQGASNGEIVYHDWSGIGWTKENPETGESGWMLSGMIAGGCPVDAVWLNQHYQEILSQPYTGPSNNDPLAARYLVKVLSTDKQPPAKVGSILPEYLAVFVSDSNGLPVRGAKVTFRTIAGGGKLRCMDFLGLPTVAPADQCTSQPTNKSGIAKVQLILGKKTEDNPIYQLLNATDKNYTQLGLNLVTASVESYNSEISLAGPFQAFGKPDMRDRIEKVYGEGTTTVVNNPAGSLAVKVVDQYGNPISNAEVTFSTLQAVSLNPAVTLPTTAQGFRNIEFYRNEECNLPYPLYGDCATYYTEIDAATEYFGAVVNAVLGNTVNTKYTVKASASGVPSAEFTLSSTGYRDVNNRYLPTGINMGYLTIVNDKGEPVNAARAGEELKAPLMAGFYQYSDDYTTEGTIPCTIQHQQTSCWKIKPKGTVTMTKVENGAIAFTPIQGNGISAPTQNLGAGLYRARYTTGVTPAVNKIIAEGNANIAVPVIYYDPNTQEYLATASTPTTKNITLNSGQWALFNKDTSAPIYLPTPDTKQTLEYVVYGVDVPFTIESGLILVNEDGQITTDATFKYTILPPEYNAIIADVDIFKTDANNTDEWLGYLPGDKTQGEGTAGYVKGSKFDVNTHYKAQVVLNRGTDAEIKGRNEIRNDNIGNDNSICEQNEACRDKVTIPLGRVELFTVPTTTFEAPASVIGAVTDGVTKLQLKLTVPHGFDELPSLKWRLMDPQLFSTATNTERGTLLNGSGSPEDSLPVIFESGAAKATYRVPETFVRFGTQQETQDRDRPDRNVQIQLTDSGNNAQGLSDIRLKRPPVVLVHGLWGSGDRKNQSSYSWKYVEPLFNQKGLFEILSLDYQNANASSFAINAERIERSIDDAAGLMINKGFAADKTAIVTHSMGGLITREFCRNNIDYCREKIHKFITIDSPHLGSELANLLSAANGQPTSSCYQVLPRIELTGNKVWQNGTYALQGGLVDLMIGSDALARLAAAQMPFSWSAVIGSAMGGNIAYDAGLKAMWAFLLHFCNKVPDASFASATGGEAVFLTANDRIVNVDSQMGPADEHFFMVGVDHTTVLNLPETITVIQNILENP